MRFKMIYVNEITGTLVFQVIYDERSFHIKTVPIAKVSSH